MKNGLFYLLLLFSFNKKTTLNAQVTTPRIQKPIISPTTYDPNKYGASLSVTDVNGRPFKNLYEGVDGSPYFINQFNNARVTLNKGLVYNNVKVKLDLHTHEVHVIISNEKEIIAEDGLINRIVILDSAAGKVYKFKAGLPEINKNNGNSFYQILSEGRLQLLRYIKKEIKEMKDVMSGEIKKEFSDYVEYYVFSDSTIIKLKKDKRFIIGLMKDQDQKIIDYVKENKVNFKNIDSIAALFEYYNSLVQPF